MARRYGPQLERLWAVAGAGRWVAIGGERDAEGVLTSEVHLFDHEGQEQGSVAFDAPVRALAILSGDLLVAGTERGELIGHGLGRPPGELAFRLSAHAGAVRALAVDGDRRRLWSVGDDGAVAGYALQDGRLVPRGRHAVVDAPLYAVAVDEAEGWAAVAGADGVARVLSVDDLAAPPKTIAIGESELYALAFTHDGRLVGGGADGSVRVVYLEGAPDEEDRSGDAAHTRAVRGLLFGPQLFDAAERPRPRRLFSVGEDGALKAWTLDTKRKPKTIELGSARLRGLAWLAPPAQAPAEARGGRLLIVDSGRRLTILPLDAEGEPAEDDHVQVEARLAKLSRDARASSEQVRCDALRALGALPEDQARASIERALRRDRAPEVRSLAAKVLGETGRRRSRPVLREVLNDERPEVGLAALAALERLEVDAPLAALRPALAAKRVDVRWAAVQKLPAARSVSPLVPGLLADALLDEAAKVRLAALDGLYGLAEDPLEPTRVALERGPEDIRMAALERLARAGATARPAGRDLVERALDDGAPDVRSRAFLLLAATRPALLAQLRRRDPRIERAVEKLERDAPFLSSAESTSLTEDDRWPLFAALASRHADGALRGALNLAFIGDPRAIGPLLQLSRETEGAVRTLALDALLVAAREFPGDDRIRARIEWMLDDPQESLRGRAFDGLLTLAGDEGPPRLELARLALGASRPDVRGRALPLLVEFGGDGRFRGEGGLREAADGLLGDALDDEDGTVRTEAFRTLWAWHREDPRSALERAARSRQADVRRRVVAELERVTDPWAAPLLIARVGDSASEVGLAAYKALLKRDENKARAEVHLAALSSPRPDVRANGCQECVKAPAEPLRTRLYDLIDDERPVVHLAAIEAVDALLPDDPIPFARAFDSIFYELRVRAAELLGRRRAREGVAPMRALLTIPETHFDRPSDRLRQRAAGAIADVGDVASVPFLTSLLDDGDPLVREQAGRGLATACRADNVQPLVDALAHGDLPVRSWAAEGLARLGDPRAVPVLAGTLEHEHRPLRQGAIIGLVALGPDGVRGLLQGLEDPDRVLQDLALAIIVARDVALARVGLAPDLLMTALVAAHPEIRFAAARALETRAATTELGEVAKRLVGPPLPERASDAKDWPAEAEQSALLNVVVSALASDHPAQRYAAARLLSLRPQPKAFWREAERLARPTSGDHPWIPRTAWEEEVVQPRKKDWIRRLFRPVTPPPGAAPETPAPRAWVRRLFGGSAPTSGEPAGTPPPTSAGEAYRGDITRLVFGTYAGLIRQAPPPGDADETHRVRRDSLGRLSALAPSPHVGRAAVLPVLRRALSDPHHLVRKAAVQGLREVYPDGSLAPIGLALSSSAADVGRAAVDELVERAAAGDEQARALALGAVDAPAPAVRSHALGRIPRLYPAGSLEPWFLALKSKFADVRLAVVERLVDAQDERVTAALGRALESDHEDLRLKAALALAKQGDLRTVDVLGAFLRAEDQRVAGQALDALVGLARAGEPAARPRAAAQAAGAITARLEDDPDHTADKKAALRALGQLRSEEGAPTILSMLETEDPGIRKSAFDALVALGRPPGLPDRVYADGTRRPRLEEQVLVRLLPRAAANEDPEIRRQVAAVLRDVHDRRAEAILARLLEDRDVEVRTAAARCMAERLKYVEDAGTAPLERALRRGQRELVLPAALGLAERRRPEAFLPLMLVFKAGAQAERSEAVLGLGTLGDGRALQELYRLVDGEAELSEEDRALVPAAAEAFGAVLPALTAPDEVSRARQTLDRLAAEGQAEVRKAAFAGLRRAGDEASRATLERVVADRYEPSDLRRAAVDQLAQLGSSGSEAVLADVLSADDRRLRHAALAALKKILPEARTKVSLLALQSRHADIAQPAAVFLARHGEPNTLVGHLVEIRDARVRRQVRRGLIRRGAYAVPALPPLLAADAPPARAEGAWLAGASGDPQLAAPVQRAAERAMAKWRDTRRERGAVDRLRAEEEAWLAALWASARVGADAAAVARAALEGPGEAPPRVRTQALRHLMAHGGAGDRPVVEPFLSAPEPEVRRAAAAALAGLAPGEAVAVLERAAVADPSAVAPLVERAWATGGRALVGAGERRQLVLPRALGRAAVEDLVEVAKGGGDEQARLTALAALGRIGTKEAEVFLASVLADRAAPDAVRAGAFRALRRAQRAQAVRFEEGQDQDRGRGRGGFAASDLDEDLDEDEDDEDLDEDEDDEDLDEDEDEEDDD